MAEALNSKLGLLKNVQNPERPFETISLSIIIPTFNRQSSLDRCLDSILNSDFRSIGRSLEIIIVDDGSDVPACLFDRALHPTVPFPIRLIRQVNMGPGSARNAASNVARGSILLFLDDDCTVDSKALERCLALFDNPSIEVVGADIGGTAGDNWLERIKNARSAMSSELGADLVKVLFIPGCAYAIRKTTFQNVGGFDEAFLYHEDDDLWKRLVLNNVALYRCRSFKVFHHIDFKNIRVFYSKSRYWSGECEDLFLKKYSSDYTSGSLNDRFCSLRVKFLNSRAKSWGRFTLIWRLTSVGFLFIFWETCKNFSKLKLPLSVSRTAFTVASFVWTLAEVFTVVRRYWFMWIHDFVSGWGILREAFTYLWYRISQSGPMELVLFITSRCQADCDHCFYFEKLNRTKKELQLEDYDRISKGIGNIYKIYLSGGEPFLNRDLSRIVRIFYRRNKLKLLSVPTNGYLSEHTVEEVSAILRDCPSLKVNINVSLDGKSSDHDRVRKLPNSFANATVTLRALCQLKKVNPQLNVSINSTLMPSNQKGFKSFLEGLKVEFPEIGNINADVSYARLEDGLSKNRSVGMKITEVRKLGLMEWIGGTFPLWKGNPLKYGVDLTNAIRDEALLKLYESVQDKGKQPLRCLAPRLFGVIRENGDYSFCEQRPAIGNVLNRDMGSLLNGEKAAKERLAVYQGVCACSHCIFQDATFTASLWKPKAWWLALQGTLSILSRTVQSYAEKKSELRGRQRQVFPNS